MCMGWVACLEDTVRVKQIFVMKQHQCVVLVVQLFVV